MPTPARASADRIDTMLRFIATIDYAPSDLTTKPVAWRLRRAAHWVDTEARRNLSRRGMELWELELLTALLRHERELTMGDLQEIAQLTSGAITNRVTRLERDGYVTREIVPADRRQVRVRLTDAGARRAREVIEANNAFEETLFAGVDRATLERLARDLRTVLLATEGPDPRA